jgi:hypothetical protein
MMTLLHIILTGFLVRADGWGTDNPRWQRVAKFLNVWSCAGLFTLLSLFYFPPLVALACGASFVLYRISGFNGWQNWLNMLWRGFWPTFIGFTVLSLVAHGVPYWGVLSVPFAALYMLVYAGGYKWLPETILGFNRHVWIEHASGWLFGATVMLVV